MCVRFTKEEKKKSSTKLVRINRFLDVVGLRKKMAPWYLWERNGKIITREVGCLKLRLGYGYNLRMRQYRGKTPQNSRTEKL